MKYLLAVALVQVIQVHTMMREGTSGNRQFNVLENLEMGYGHVMMFPPER